MNSDNANRGQVPDSRFAMAGVGHSSMYRTCFGKAGNCGPRSPVGSTRPNGRFYCRECSEARAARANQQQQEKASC